MTHRVSSQSKRVLIVGGVAGGASCAARLRRVDERAEIVMFEKGPYVSFANCGLPYYVGDVIVNREKLLVATPKTFEEQFNIRVRVQHEVTRIDRQARQIEVLDHAAGQVRREAYDVLVLSPGAQPLKPPLPGIDLEGIFSLRTIPDSDNIRRWIETHQPKKAVVVGAGFIGLEMVENLVHRGLEVTLMEMLPQIMPPMDPEMVAPVQEHLKEKGVRLSLGSPVKSFEKGTSSLLVVKNNRDESFPADLVIVGLGVRPDTALAREAGLAIGPTGGIQVDRRMRTSDPHIFAVGDAVEVVNVLTGQPMLLALAGPANRQGRVAADVITGRDMEFRGVQGTSVCGVFDMTIAQTGASEKQLKKAGIPYEKVYLYPGSHAGYYPGAETIDLKLLFAPGDGRVLGAQAVGRDGVEKRIDVLAMAIQMGATVFDLEQSELCYAPQYGSAKDPVNMAGFVAANHLRGDSPLVYWEHWNPDAPGAPLVLDVLHEEQSREKNVPGTLNIPLAELRDRLAELPRDRAIWVTCQKGQTSYYAVRVLRQHGFDAFNLTGAKSSYVNLHRAGMLYEGCGAIGRRS